MPSKGVENWDDDDEFADIDESNFLISSVSSAGTQEGFYQMPASATDAAFSASNSESLRSSNLRGHASRPSNLRSFSEADENDDFSNDFDDLTTKMSKIDLAKLQGARKPSIDYSTITGTITGTVRRLGGSGSSASSGPEHYGGAFRDDMDMDLDGEDIQTIRVASGRKISSNSMAVPRVSSNARSNSRMLISGDFYRPPEQIETENKNRKKNISFDNDDEIIFDDTENLADRFTRVKNNRQMEVPGSLDDSLDDSFGFGTESRLSTYSLTTSATSYTDNEEDDDDFGFSKEAGDLFDKPSVLQQRLKEVRHQNELESERDRELLAKGRKYDTIRSNGSGNSIKANFRDNDNTITNKQVLVDFEDPDEDLLQGFDLKQGDDFISTKGTLHRNVVIKATNQRTGTSPQKKAPRETQSIADFKAIGAVPGGPDYSSVRVKKSMPVLRPPINQKISNGRGTNIAGSTSPQRPRPTHHTERRVSGNVASGSPPKQFIRASNPRPPSRNQDMFENEDYGNLTIDATSTLAMKPGQFQPKRLRPVQSMLTMQPQEQSKASRQFVRPRRGPTFEQDVLDQFDDLDVDFETESRFVATPKSKGHLYSGTVNNTSVKHVPLDTFREKFRPRKLREKDPVQNSQFSPQYQNQTPPQHQHQQHPSTVRSPTKSSLLKDNSQKKRGPKRRGPGLIRHLGVPIASEESNGMHFNPTKLVWEGNDIELKKFESVNPKTPGLIAFISNKGQQVVGDMVFDPDRLCWINIKDDHSDPFEGLDDLEVSSSIGGKHHNNAAVASAAVTAAEKLASSIGGDFAVGNEFNLSAKFIEKMKHEDDRWARKTKGWFSPNEQIDREFLKEIRSMVMR
ncbi:Bfa1p [Sugiyamaella lignohabitans]|uniref:Bfa1p n=1 Tax=Sugiyamaella lignohabitans TaxID=796027 RepID=A0A167CNF8_9ASCO|nr:Bfa1p [Sugiyamaella lignohabitans]ANB11920.1 Bfa1p [Sugiyamaella lignohabitans]